LCLTLLLCYSVTLLLCYSVTLLLCYSVTLLLCYSVTLLLCYSVTLLLCYSVTLLLCYSVTLLLCYSVTLLLFSDHEHLILCLTFAHRVLTVLDFLRPLHLDRILHVEFEFILHLFISILRIFVILAEEYRTGHQFFEEFKKFFFILSCLLFLLLLNS
jgi:hypothetical protein